MYKRQGWYCIGRPLVSALFIGLILGDVKTAMILGTCVQLIFIGLVTPGGSITPDMNLATFIAIPLGVVAHLDSCLLYTSNLARFGKLPPYSSVR